MGSLQELLPALGRRIMLGIVIATAIGAKYIVVRVQKPAWDPSGIVPVWMLPR